MGRSCISRSAADSCAIAAQRPAWATALAGLCAATVVFLVTRDIVVPEVRAVEIWLGFELRGWLALATAPIHYAIFGAAAWGYWHCRAWIWPWAAVYAFYIAVSHLIWNLNSTRGEGLAAGLLQFGLFSVPAIALLFAKPRPQT